MTDTSRKFVLPGDEIGASEEYMAGEGTYERDGKIFSAVAGFLNIDPGEMTASVESATSTPVVLSPGDIVFGVIYDARGSNALVNVVRVVDREREIALGDNIGSLHISKVKKEFLKDMGEAYKVSDIIRAKVVQVEPSLQLSTAEDDLGVIIAHCLECRVRLERTKGGLECPGCEAKYKKKLAKDYGEYKL